MLRIVDIIEGIQNYVCNWAKVRKGEEVVIVADSKADELVVETTAGMVQAQGANVQVIWISHNPIPLQGAGRSVTAALERADKYLRLNHATGHDKETQTAVMAYGLSVFGVASTSREFFASEAARYPIELVLAMGRKQIEKIFKKRRVKVRLTHENGTDLRAEGAAEDWVCDYCNPDFTWEVEGSRMGGVYPRQFPGAMVGLVPPLNGEGVVQFHAYAGIGRSDLRLTYKDNKCVKIEGPEASRLQELIKDVPMADTLVEIMFGLHPRIRPEATIDQKPIPTEAERKAGNVHVAIGNRPWGRHFMKAHTPPGKIGRHLDGFIVKPSLYIDDEPVILKGHNTILDDPEIRKIASQYGDPARLLTETV